mmetsp:Transcript_16123/g.23721  ORF Transcript_16123/g.23721 Transcript_16123/m.23721 type:complete len:244 (+) Transcript_16123:65-796(+)|eukprot:CAMPEP_0194220232 /NCGR_PEP_ID=MMETSP0156-20130528/27811_1 /TAXON_ID=33649 /ORGANISM="Thalassionema nitzschioides, Strain L26-B" /LENGTH=243 /DNA_ID=CAMNT_0038950181 /DNA_START=44 /DNA_END=775 /DNA_ORIENTATION=+
MAITLKYKIGRIIILDQSTSQKRRSSLLRMTTRTVESKSSSKSDVTEVSEVSEINWSRRSGYTTDYLTNLKPAIRLPGAPSRSSNQSRKNVTFGSVQIREHELKLDYNPSVSCGAAVGLGWESIDLPTNDLDDFEAKRGPRRSKTEFQIPRFMREEMLREFGYSRGELAEACKIIDAARKQRRLSIAAQEIEFTQIAIEWTSRRIKKVIGRRSSYQEEEAKLWKNAQLMSERSYIKDVCAAQE